MAHMIRTTLYVGADDERRGGVAAGGEGDQAQGRVVHVDPIKPTLKAPGSERLKLEM